MKEETMSVGGAALEGAPALSFALQDCRNTIHAAFLQEEAISLDALLKLAKLDKASRVRIADYGSALVETVRLDTTPGVMEAFLAEYGLSTKEGVALMCLAEALLRVPDSISIDALINDKIAHGRWREHLGQSKSGLINLSSYSLATISGLLGENGADVKATLRSMVMRLGMPVVRSGAQLFMKELGRQFVLGETIESAVKKATATAAYRYSFDMLGESALSDTDATKYFQNYRNAIAHIASKCLQDKEDLLENPGISIKLSALHPRYEWTHRETVMAELVPRVLLLAREAKAANMGLAIDAEEAQRLELSLDVITEVLQSEELAGWDGFGVVVQAYSKRAPYVLDYVHLLATELDRKITVRLVKGAYWDAEIKRSQVLGLEDYPVFTHKAHSDISYIACAQKLYGMRERIFPQFATHNAHTIAAILDIYEGAFDSFEFQRLYGMGENLYQTMRAEHTVACRVYAPVGVHRDLLAYLVRRMLENGANSSFVNQLYDAEVAATKVAEDPFLHLDAPLGRNPIVQPPHIFGGSRVNAKGWDVTDIKEMAVLRSEMDSFKGKTWETRARVAGHEQVPGQPQAVINPANLADTVGTVIEASDSEVAAAFDVASEAFASWQQTPVADRAMIFLRAADLFEHHAPEFFALLCREAGKSLPDAIAEVREAVDFLRYYAHEARQLEPDQRALGIISCISPWNFPLAIFIGQITAALVTGNCVLAKPAGQTPLVASVAVDLLFEAGLPQDVLAFLPGGPTVGQAIVSNPKVGGVCFTGSTATAQHINRTLADTTPMPVPLIAETGGINAMIVDSTALPEQAVRDILASSFQSAGQRCSALRILYVQEDVKDRILDMLLGAMDRLKIGDPWDLATDVGPVIDDAAEKSIRNYIAASCEKGQLIRTLPVPEGGRYVPPTLLSVSGIEEMDREIFGPVLHVATYKAANLEKVIDGINAKGYGLTLGMHSRIEDRIAFLKHRAHVGNIYINRNQIGAVVGSQPFGGEGLSGTGPKAGGPHYLQVFTTRRQEPEDGAYSDGVGTISLPEVDKARAAVKIPKRDHSALASNFCEAFPNLQADIRVLAGLLTQNYPERTLMPGPVGEDNMLWRKALGTILCLGPDERSAVLQLIQALWFGNKALITAEDKWLIKALKPLQEVHGFAVLSGNLDISLLKEAEHIDAIAYSAADPRAKKIQQVLASREGPILPLIDEIIMPFRYIAERHVCTDTTAAGGNVALLAAQG